MKYLRPFTIEDAPDLALAVNNKKVQDNLRDGMPFPYTVEDAEAFLSGVFAAPEGSQYLWAIQIDGKAIGSLGVHRMQNIHRLTAEMGYYIAEPYWGLGIMTASIKEACDYIFTHTDIVRIFAEPFAHNAASCRSLEKAGFTLEGKLRNNAIKNGKIIDMCMYSIIANLQNR